MHVIVFISAVLCVFWGCWGGGTYHSFATTRGCLLSMTTSIVSPFGHVDSVALQGPRVCVYSHIAVTVKHTKERAREFRKQRVSDILVISVHRSILLGAFDKIAKSEY